MKNKISNKVYLWSVLFVMSLCLFTFTNFYIETINYIVIKVQAGAAKAELAKSFAFQLRNSLFLLLTYLTLVAIFHNRIIDYVKSQLSKDFKRPLYIVIGLFVFYAIYFSIITCNKYFRGDYYMVDLGIQNQFTWNSSYLRFFQNTCSETSNFLGGHFSLDLLFVVPFYAMFRSPVTLLILQSIILGTGVFPVYYLAKKVLQNEFTALFFSLLYLLSIPLHGANLFEFHEEIFAPLFLLSAYYFLESKNNRGLLVSLFLLCLVKESLPLTVFGIGIYIFVVNKEYLLGGAIAFLSIIYTFFVLNYVLPYFGDGKLALGHVYGTIELSQGIVHSIGKMISHPIATMAFIFKAKKLTYIFLNLLFVLFLPLFSGKRIFLILPALAIILLSDQSGMSSIYTHNICSILPTVFYLSIIGFKNLSLKLKTKFDSFEALMLLLLFIATIFLFYPLDFFVNKRDYLIVQSNAKEKKIFQTLSDIPQNASVMSSNSLGDVVSSRLELYRIPKAGNIHYSELFRIPPIENMDYIVFDIKEVDKVFLDSISILKDKKLLFEYYNDGDCFFLKRKY